MQNTRQIKRTHAPRKACKTLKLSRCTSLHRGWQPFHLIIMITTMTVMAISWKNKPQHSKGVNSNSSSSNRNSSLFLKVNNTKGHQFLSNMSLNSNKNILIQFSRLQNSNSKLQILSNIQLVLLLLLLLHQLLKWFLHKCLQWCLLQRCNPKVFLMDYLNLNNSNSSSSQGIKPLMIIWIWIHYYFHKISNILKVRMAYRFQQRSAVRTVRALLRRK